MKNKSTPIKIIAMEEKSLPAERDTGITQSPFHQEYELFLAIKNGDAKTLGHKMADYQRGGIVMGNMSVNSHRQARYWGVATIAVAVHYAILGGMDETDAFNMSDECIRHIDSLESIDEIMSYLFDRALDLTYAVFNAKSNLASTPPIRRCIHYIHVHLHERITTEDLSRECALSRSYLSTRFSREMGTSLHNYILSEKLSAAELMLSEGLSVAETAYRLSFCSETHFINCYKKKYGHTPGKQ